MPPGDRDESRFAQATKQMNETGDYVRIMNGAVPRNRKPIGIYWLQAPFAAAAGPGLANPIWPYRVPSLLGGLAAVLATYGPGCAWPAAVAAALAGAMLAGCVILTVEVHIAKTDAALLGATTLAMAVLGRAWLGAPVRRRQAALFWLAMGAGILLKGPITPMVAGLAAATLCVWERRAGWLAALRPAGACRCCWSAWRHGSWRSAWPRTARSSPRRWAATWPASCPAGRRRMAASRPASAAAAAAGLPRQPGRAGRPCRPPGPGGGTQPRAS